MIIDPEKNQVSYSMAELRYVRQLLARARTVLLMRQPGVVCDYINPALTALGLPWADNLPADKEPEKP